jgi:hypothetical protein
MGSWLHMILRRPIHSAETVTPLVATRAPGSPPALQPLPPIPYHYTIIYMSQDFTAWGDPSSAFFALAMGATEAGIRDDPCAALGEGS